MEVVKSTQDASVTKSTHQCPCFEFDFEKTEPHPDKEVVNLRVFQIPDSSYSYVLNKNDWGNYKGLVVWATPDSLVDTTLPEFSWLASEGKYGADSTKPGKYARIKAKRLRGIISFGLLTKVDDDYQPCEDASAKLGILHYDPEEASQKTAKDNWGLGNGEVCGGPNLICPKYDVDAFMKYGMKQFTEGEPVHITQKIHGENFACVFSSQDGELHVKSRKEWKREFTTAPQVTLDELTDRMIAAEIAKKISKGLEGYITPEELEEIKTRANAIFQKRVVNFKSSQSKWWWTLRNTPGLTDFLQSHPDHVVFGEQYGMNAGHQGDRGSAPYKFRAFDILKGDRFLDIQEAMDLAPEVPWVPTLATNWPLDFSKLEQFYCCKSTLNPKETAEGCVIRPMKERVHPKYGRVLLKLINPDY